MSEDPPTPHDAETQAAPPPATMPRQLGHYHLTRMIAMGGMAVVYEGRQEQPRRTVAVKILRRGVASRSALRRFEQESQILARLRHPGIAQVFDAGMHEDPATPETVVPYFVMEYIPGARTLTEFASARKLDTRARLELFLQVCEAVHFGHRHGVIHRDLKPGNLLVDSNGTVKVIDFGVARTTDSDLAVTTLQTLAGQLIGTVPYMSPEQVEADPLAIDARSDVYALGVVLYELLTGRLPYDTTGVSVAELSRLIREQPPAPASATDSSLRGDLETILQTALRKDPARRYESVDRLRRDIERYLHGEPIEARRDRAAYVAWTLSRRVAARHPVITMILAAAAATILAWYGGVPLTYEWTPVSRWVERSVITTFGAPLAPSRLDRVRVVVLTPDTNVEELATEAGVEGVRWTPATIRSLRRLHGHLMQRLAGAGPRVVVWDMRFPGFESDEPDPDTDPFIEGIRALDERGIPVVVGVGTWDPDQMQPAVIHPGIARHAHVGGLTVHMDDDQAWILNLVVKKAVDEPVPSLALAAVAAAEFPHADEITYDVDEEAGRVEARGWRRDPTRPARRRQTGPSLRVDLSGVSDWDGPTEFGIDPGDTVGRYLLEMPADDVLQAATIPYADVLRADEAQLRRWFDSRALLLWVGPAGAELSRHPGGREIDRYYGWAVGLDMLLGDGPLRLPRPDHQLIAMPLLAAIGVLVAAGTDPRWRRRMLVLAVMIALAFVASVLTYRLVHYFYNPVVPVLGMIIAAELSAGVLRIRAARRY